MKILDKWISICGGSRVLAWLTVINVAVWLVVAILSIATSAFHLHIPLESWLSLPSYFPTFITRPWTLLTYMVVQYDFLHLLFNVLWLYWFGIIIVNVYSDRFLLWLYIGGGLAGGVFFLASSALGWGGGWLCGSSASVLAVMAAAAVRLPNHRLNLFLIGPVALKWVAIICAVLTFIGGGGNQPAHIGGLLFGIIYSLGLWPLTVSLHRGGSSPSRVPNLPHAGGAGGGTRRRPDKVIDAFERHRRDMARLDEILDKIKTSGYESLSRRERSELQDLSTRIKK